MSNYTIRRNIETEAWEVLDATGKVIGDDYQYYYSAVRLVEGLEKNDLFAEKLATIPLDIRLEEINSEEMRLYYEEASGIPMEDSNIAVAFRRGYSLGESEGDIEDWKVQNISNYYGYRDEYSKQSQTFYPSEEKQAFRKGYQAALNDLYLATHPYSTVAWLF